ncbi:unnamed protein product [Lactuca saligna]|uniref:Uncharacterized protein n=1 Tax=Lactuca saligna TaxID=75948 RepID=A0AA35YYA3_LACSI|nr:unnamed protein product [Lactuca saligna]
MIVNIDVGVSKFEEENTLKSKQISDLQLNLGALYVGYFELKNKLISEFSDKFKTSVVEPNAAEPSNCAPSQVAQDPPVDQHVKTTHIIDQFDSEPAQAHPRITLKQCPRQVTAQRKRVLLFMKNSNKNVCGDQPQLTVTKLEQKQFRRKSGKVEYYNHQNYFCSWTRVNLGELADAPFHNPSNDPRATDFTSFLEN